MTIRFSKFTVLALAATLGGAVLAANIAGAAGLNHARYSGMSTSQPSLARHYAPSDHGRYIYGVSYGASARSRVEPAVGHGILEENLVGGP